MKTKLACSVAAFVMAQLFLLCSAEASFLDDLTGNNPGYTQSYTYTVTNPGQPQQSGTVQYGGTGPRVAAPAPQSQPVVRPQAVAPRVAYQQPILQAQENAQQRPSSKATPKKKSTQGASAANNIRSVKVQPAKQRQQGPAAKQYQPNYTAQPRPVVRSGYSQTPQTGYYTNPYQNQYTASPNYYQGYYNSWGSSTQACPPGRA